MGGHFLKMRRAGSAVSVLFLLVLALAVQAQTVQRTTRSAPPGWKSMGSVSSSLLQPVTLTLALRQSNLAQLEHMFWEVSTPGSPHYRQFATPEQVANMVAPHPRTVRIIRSWLREYGVDDDKMQFNPSGDFLIVQDVEPRLIEKIFSCHLALFAHPATPQRAQVCVGGYSLPSEVAAVIDFVGGLDYYPKWAYRHVAPPKAKRQVAQSSAPVVSQLFAGDESFSLYYVPVCSDGTPVQSSNLNCASGPSPSFLSILPTQDGFQRSVVLRNQMCGNCSTWSSSLQGYCQSLNSYNNWSASTIYCQTPPVVLGLKNYVPFTVTFSTQFSDGSSSPYVELTSPFYLGKWVTPKTLRDYYGATEDQTICKHPQNSQSVAEFFGQYYSPRDLATFFEMTGTRYPGSVELVGPNNGSLPGGEAQLDIQYIMGLAQNVTTYFWSLGTLHQGQEPFLQWITQVLNSPNPPLVHSTSYADDEPTLEVDYMNRVNVEFQKAGAAGLTLLFSSGDMGVNPGTPDAPDCLTTKSFTPAFPPTSPYVTAVGGTQFSTQTEAICSQKTQYNLPTTCDTVGEISSSVATGSRITSGGGFSNVFAMPPYQKSVVASYLQHLPPSAAPPTTYYNASGRAYPDISACARNFLVVTNGVIHPTDGTSAAAPTAAAFMTMINDVLLGLGQGKKLGFLNPTLYSLSANNFLDIIQGDNKCGEDVYSCCPYGFPTAFGWDAVTGLGSLNFPVLLRSLTN